MLQSNYLIRLLGRDFIDEFMFERIDDNLTNNTKSYILSLLHNLEIYADNSDIQCTIKNNSINIFISTKLELKIKKFFNENPEYYFI